MSHSHTPQAWFSTNWLAALCAGDHQAWQLLLGDFGPLVRRQLQTLRLQEADIDDVMQEVWQTVAQHVGEFRPESGHSGFRAWLHTLARSKFIDRQRKQERRPGGARCPVSQEMLPLVPAPDKAWFAGEVLFSAADRLAWELVEAVRADFAPRTWQAFVAVVVEGRTASEVAEQLHMTVNAVRLAHARVLTRVKALARARGLDCL